jgi:hypothetical protein
MVVIYVPRGTNLALRMTETMAGSCAERAVIGALGSLPFYPVSTSRMIRGIRDKDSDGLVV